jgi:iron complex transport system substrate-binding protein
LSSARTTLAVVAAFGIAWPIDGVAQQLPSVVSINVCSDQLLLTLADPEQILSVSWLAADPEESVLAAEASQHPLNYGDVEALLALRPDVVLGGSFTNAPARGLLERLGQKVVALDPANSVADIERNVGIVAAAIGQTARGDSIIRDLRRRSREIAASVRGPSRTAVVVRPGAFTVGADSLADDLLKLAGLRNIVAEQGLDRWGSLSLESLLLSRPDLLIFTDYRGNEASLANGIFAHPVMISLRRQVDTVSVPASLWACGLPRSLRAAEILADSAPGP